MENYIYIIITIVIIGFILYSHMGVTKEQENHYIIRHVYSPWYWSEWPWWYGGSSSYYMPTYRHYYRRHNNHYRYPRHLGPAIQYPSHGPVVNQTHRTSPRH
jgi:hypothetical protein